MSAPEVALRGPIEDEACEAVLKRHDAYAEPVKCSAGYAWVRDEEGGLLYTVTTSIKAADLAMIFRAQAQGETRGERWGEERARRRMRAALGIPEPKAESES